MSESAPLSRMGTPLTAALAVLPCRDLERSTAFYGRFGLQVVDPAPEYRLLVGAGVELHLRQADAATQPQAAGNPCGVYLRMEAVDDLAARFAPAELIHPPTAQPWGMYEFALSDPDGALVRVGWPQVLRDAAVASPTETPSAQVGN